MGKVDEAITELAKDNPRAKAGPLRMYAETAMTYAEASESVKRLGAVVVHPKTGAPMENPYLRIRERQVAIMLKIRGIDGGRVIALLEKQIKEAAAAKEAEDAE